MTTTRKVLNYAIGLILLDAANRENDAAHGGEMGDRGAGALREQVEFYKAGMGGSVPRSWDKYVTQAGSELDPEWSEYARLKEKFGDQ